MSGTLESAHSPRVLFLLFLGTNFKKLKVFEGVFKGSLKFFLRRFTQYPLTPPPRPHLQFQPACKIWVAILGGRHDLGGVNLPWAGTLGLAGFILFRLASDALVMGWGGKRCIPDLVREEEVQLD